MANYDAMINVGHGTSDIDGSYDPGATANGKQEHVIAEKIVDKAVAKCKALGINIHRDEQNYKDVDLRGNSYKYNYALSVHINAGGGARSEIYVPLKEKDLASEVQLMKDLSTLGLKNGGIKSRNYNTGNTYLRENGSALTGTDYYKEIRDAWNLGVSLDILEVGFIDSSDIIIIENNIDKIADMIVNHMCRVCGAVTKPLEPIEVPYKIRYAVCYCNDIDKRAAQYLADYYKCECIDARIARNWKHYALYLIGVGGNASPVGFSSYTTHRIAGANRYETCSKVLEICLGKKQLDGCGI